MPRARKVALLVMRTLFLKTIVFLGTLTIQSVRKNVPGREKEKPTDQRKNHWSEERTVSNQLAAGVSPAETPEDKSRLEVDKLTMRTATLTFSRKESECFA